MHKLIFMTILVGYSLSTFTCAQSDEGISLSDHIDMQKAWCRRNRNPCGKVKNLFGTIIQDIIGINYNLISWDSLKIIASVFPAFVGARMIDENLQNCFYDWHKHKNKNCPPKWCHDVAEWSIAVPITILGLQALFGREGEFREVNLAMLAGMPFVVFGKDIIKNMRFDACLRPWNEKFGCHERSSGGFPSGHVAEGTYLAIYYGLQYGPKFGIPLGIMTVGLGATFLTCNRHYLSQLIAGAGLGALYGVAAHKFINHKLYKDLSFSMSVDECGAPGFNISYVF